jgi:ElaB/YqjD/DUF883 family membrane-anchored ribosome-binding protein
MNVTDIPNDADETITRLRSSAHEAVDKIANATTRATDALGQKGEELQNAERQYAKICRDYIHGNPVASIGIAMGAGFILSRLLSNR